MEVSKAIEVGTNYLKGSDEAESVEFNEFVRLGIEALKYYQKIHVSPDHPGYVCLLGETPGAK